MVAELGERADKVQVNVWSQGKQRGGLRGSLREGLRGLRKVEGLGSKPHRGAATLPFRVP